MLDRIDEIPFEPERKRLVTVHRGPDEAVLFVKGAPEELLPRARWIEREGGPEPLTRRAARGVARAPPRWPIAGFGCWPSPIASCPATTCWPKPSRTWC